MQKFIEMIYVIAAIAITFGLAVFVHEFGHMIFALIRGVGVESFAIGMGPKVTAWKWRGIEFSLRWFPVGGFVKLHGMAPEEELIHVPEKKEGTADGEGERKTITESSYDDLNALRDKGLVTKLMVFGGGVFMNFITAIVAMAVLMMMPVTLDRVRTVVEDVKEGLPAAQAGLMTGDRLTAVAGTPVSFDDEVMKAIEERREASEDEEAELSLPLTVARAEETVNLELKLPPPDSNFYEATGLSFRLPPLVGRTNFMMPARKAGVKDGDVILAVNGEPVDSFQDVVKIVSKSVGREVELKLRRGEEELSLSMMPVKDPMNKGKALVGIVPGTDEKMRIEGMNPLKAIALAPVEAVERVVFLAVAQVKFFRDATFKDVSDNVGGPVMIAAMTADAAKNGLPELINWFVMFNLLLMMFNLLPIPVLDGGFILVSIIESVIRRPVPPKVLNPIYTVFVVFFIGLMLLITVWDVKRFFFE